MGEGGGLRNSILGGWEVRGGFREIGMYDGERKEEQAVRVTCRQDTGETNTQALRASVSSAVRKKALITPLAWQ